MAGDGGGSGAAKELDQTPTWAVATVCAVFIVISFILEKVIHRVGKWFINRRKMALFEALEKVKGELMVLGFISLLLTFFQTFITKICIPATAAHTMLPCPYRGNHHDADTKEDSGNEEHHRRLLWNDRRFLAGAVVATKCDEGHEPLISADGLHQLHIFIFFLAVFHVFFSATTMLLGRLKIRRWKDWERETSSQDYEFSNDPSRFRLTHETSFVRGHTSIWAKVPVLIYVYCFFLQFFRSVCKADYLTMRHGFINVHLAPGSKFNFRKYIKRSLEDDFKVVVGVSPLLWATFVIFLLLNVNGWQAVFWASLIPLVIILAVGTQLQYIMMKMALEIQERHAVIQGIPVVQVSDKYFWFNKPQLVLHLIHFTMFQNAFQITYFLWIWYEFKLDSCFHQNFKLVIARLCLGLGVQILCSYITLPLYALITQMGSTMKKSIFDEQTSKALTKWREAVKKKKKKQGKMGKSPKSVGSSPMQSPSHPLHRFKTTGHSTRSTTTSRRYSDHDVSDIETDTSPTSSTANLILNMELGNLESGTSEKHLQEHSTLHSDEDDFSFVKPKSLHGP